MVILFLSLTLNHQRIMKNRERGLQINQDMKYKIVRHRLLNQQWSLLLMDRPLTLKLGWIRKAVDN